MQRDENAYSVQRRAHRGIRNLAIRSEKVTFGIVKGTLRAERANWGLCLTLGGPLGIKGLTLVRTHCG